MSDRSLVRALSASRGRSALDERGRYQPFRKVLFRDSWHPWTMLQTSARLLRLLSLLQARTTWSGRELADRLGVTARTVRNDVGRLGSPGYPEHGSPGGGGGAAGGVAQRGSPGPRQPRGGWRLRAGRGRGAAATAAGRRGGRRGRGGAADRRRRPREREPAERP